MPIQILDIEQGSEEWLQLRKTKVTATDASVIMGVNPWKSIEDLHKEKSSKENNLKRTPAMQRGIDLEPIARNLFIKMTGIKVKPAVVVDDWLMASLDGLGECGELLEIKCAGPRDHALAMKGKIPKYYYPQLQHQMMVTDKKSNYYFSFDGVEGIIIEVDRDDDYIQYLKIEEMKFFASRMQYSEAYKASVDESWMPEVFGFPSIT